MLKPSRLDLQSRLMEMTGDQWIAPRIVLLRAPAGYGKTGTIARWLGEQDDAGSGMRWVRCAPGGADGLWNAIAAELAALTGGGSGGSGAHGEAGGAGDPAPSPESMRAIVHGLAASLPEPATIVIDDYHFATNAENDLALAEVCAAAPNLTLLIAARRVQLLDGPLVAARVRLRVFGPRDLAFTTAEAVEMAARLGVPDGERLRTALERTKGWPLAVRAVIEPAAVAAASTDDANGGSADPLENLDRFALHHLEIVGDLARRVLLAAAQLDAISLDQAAEFTGAEIAAVRIAVYELLELGVLVPRPAEEGTEFRCHRAVRATLHTRSERSASSEQRRALYAGRASRIADWTPLTALRLYCAAGALDEAEMVLWRHFSAVIDEPEPSGRILRTLPEHTLLTQPTLAAARLYIEMPNPAVPPTTLSRLTELWQQGVQQRLERDLQFGASEIALPLLVQAMVSARLLGRIDAAISMGRELESRLEAEPAQAWRAEAVDPAADRTDPQSVYALGALPVYHREIASTALIAGDYPRARRGWERLRAYAEELMLVQWSGRAENPARTAARVASGRRWLLAALNEMAFTEVLDGDMRRAEEYLAEAESLAASTGAAAPGLAWVSGEIARAHLSYEIGDDEMLARAVERLTPLSDRIEQWPLLVIAEAAAVRRLRGPDWGLSQLRSAFTGQEPGRSPAGAWNDYLAGYQATLHTVLGDFASTERLLSALPEGSPLARLERARLALFAGDDIAALLFAQGLGDAETTRRQQLDRSLITAVASWGCNERENALRALGRAAELLRDCGLPSSLLDVPFTTLREVAVAARDAGVCDVLEAIDAVPELSRAMRYERLTEMEHRTLEAIAQHRTANQAAAALYIAPGTVKKHLASVYRKLHAGGRDEAILQATRMGLLQPAPQVSSQAQPQTQAG